MRQTFLTALRQAESRPLAAALACLLLVAALIGGVHTGAMAADQGSDTAFVLCSHDTGGTGQQPAGQHADLCCVAGCLVHAPALDTPLPTLLVPEFAGRLVIETAPGGTIVRHETRSEHPPRGPPSFA